MPYPTTDYLFAAGILDHTATCRDPQCCYAPMDAFGPRHVVHSEDGMATICLCTTGQDHGEDEFDQPREPAQ